MRQGLWQPPGWTLTGILLATGLLAAGCSTMQDRTNTPRTSGEQLLLAQAIERGLSDLSLPLSTNTAVAVKSFGFTDDKEVAHRQIESWFLAQGYPVVEDDKAAINVRVLIQALGTERSETFFGVPAISSLLIPLALPELVVYRAARQQGVARYQLELTDAKTGALLHRSRLCEGTAFLNQFTVLFLFTFQRTDLLPPPPFS